MCICGKKTEFSQCCEPIILQHKQAKTAEELMRSRYCAYVEANGAYLVYSSVKENQFQEDIQLIEEFANSVQWLKLDVLHVTKNNVEFKAYYRDKNGIQLLHEKSNFIQEDGIWKYKDGDLFSSKIERNELCPCGSGKKYKKCCA